MMSRGETAVDEKTFRRLLGRFATGVTVITTGTMERPHGMTANAFASVSLAPPLVLVCIDHRRESHRLIQEHGYFAVSVLAESQRQVSDYFAGRLPAQGMGGRSLFCPGPGGAPVVAGAIAYLECSLEAVYPGGDHSIFVGRVRHGREGEAGRPLVFFEGAYRILDNRPAP